MENNGSIYDERSLEIRVRYQETDQMGVVYHANYFVWFEMGRTEQLREVTGLSYREMEESDSLLAIVKVECSYHMPARYDDLLTLKTRVIRMTRVQIEHEYKLYRGDQLLAEGHTVLASVSRSGRVKALPPVFAAFAGKTQMSESEAKPKVFGGV